MRLLSRSESGVFQLHEFHTLRAPPYGILSHTWGSDEVTYSDILAGTGKNKAGFEKILFCWQQAVQDGLQYFWIDTCCIDKTSSAELQEAINSMFRWYENSARCYVYLQDVVMGNSVIARSQFEQQLSESRWFTRAWTLPELIAPRVVQFFSRDEKHLGDKFDLAQLISDITDIPVYELRWPSNESSVSDTLSWAKRRQATLEEDRIYSLLNLLQVYMPIRYGEGFPNAFHRLESCLQEQGRISQPTKSSRSGMRLLSTKSDPLRLVPAPDHGDLQYAILSHTWGDDEVTFEDIGTAAVEQKGGYSKLKSCCGLAVKHGFDYVWVDTCCIDKSSSSELQEAICSMYMWYKNASICYAYLSDFNSEEMDSLDTCNWFKRGWTLQELIAPRHVEFYDRNWTEVGTKQSLCGQIAAITSIDPRILRGDDPTRRTVAERMSWAALRETTRLEDIAYSLMGLFKVFMPMLYGEGNRAFIRLQEEIIKQTEDYTIFSWQGRSRHLGQRGIFAHSPVEFKDKGPTHVIPRLGHRSYQPEEYLPPALSSRGLVLTLPLAPWGSKKTDCLGWVSCRAPKDGESPGDAELLCIWLREIQSNPQVFARISPEILQIRPAVEIRNFKQRTICVLPSNADSAPSLTEPRGRSRVTVHYEGFHTILPLTPDTEENFNSHGNSYFFSDEVADRCLAAILFGHENEFIVFIGIQDGLLWCSIATHENVEDGLNILDDINGLCSRVQLSDGYSDRAKKSLFGSRKVTALLRTARCTRLDASVFNLHIEITD